MNLLWISKRRYTHKDAYAERFGRVYELPAAWAATGQAVALELVDYRGKLRESRSDNGLDICSTPLRSPAGLHALAHRAERSRPDVIVASGDCFVGLMAWRLAKLTGARFVFDVYDDYRAFGAYRFFAGFRAYELLLERAALVLYASKALAARHSSDTPWTLVPNGIDPADFRPANHSTARKAIGLSDDGTRWIGYFGGMEAERGPADLVEAVGMLHAEDPSLRLVLCGGPPPKAGAFDAPWVEFRGMVPHSAIPDYINACDVVTLPYRRGPIIDMASSVKIAEYLHCERPVVATRTPNLMENFASQAMELGEAICDPGDPADLARAIAAQLRHPFIASRPTAHTWQVIAHKTLATLRALP